MVISIVGARRCTKYGEDIAYRLAYALAEQGVVIISGMAYGIDTAAHRGRPRPKPGLGIFCTGIGLLSGYLTLLSSLKRASVLVLSARHNAP